MKISLKLLVISFVLMFLVTYACKKEGDTESVTNHSISISNQNANSPVQFTRLIITPTDGSSQAIQNDFVLNPGSTLSIKVKLPKTGSYKIDVNGPTQSISWASIMLDSNNGNTTIYLLRTPYYCTNSTCSGIYPTSCNPY